MTFAWSCSSGKRGQHPHGASRPTLHPLVNTLRSSNATLTDSEMKRRGLVPAYWRVLKSHYLILQLVFLQQCRCGSFRDASCYSSPSKVSNVHLPSRLLEAFWNSPTTCAFWRQNVARITEKSFPSLAIAVIYWEGACQASISCGRCRGMRPQGADILHRRQQFRQKAQWTAGGWSVLEHNNLSSHSEPALAVPPTLPPHELLFCAGLSESSFTQKYFACLPVECSLPLNVSTLSSQSTVGLSNTASTSWSCS